MRSVLLPLVLLAVLGVPGALGASTQPASAQIASAQSTTDPETGSAAAESSRVVDGPRRFWVNDTHRYTSPWFAGAHRKMINFGCTRAPYYDPDPRCTADRGFHHGLDIAMPCGTELFAGFRGWVVRPRSAGALGSAYGPNAFRIRNYTRGVDVVFGHVKRVYVAPGERVRTGRLIARANKLGAPDGCHLHFEVRPIAGGYLSAERPNPELMLQRQVEGSGP